MAFDWTVVFSITVMPPKKQITPNKSTKVKPSVVNRPATAKAPREHADTTVRKTRSTPVVNIRPSTAGTKPKPRSIPAHLEGPATAAVVDGHAKEKLELVSQIEQLKESHASEMQILRDEYDIKIQAKDEYIKDLQTEINSFKEQVAALKNPEPKTPSAPKHYNVKTPLPIKTTAR